jgi:glycosyltransferase involved in cell wall biosynthesis
MAVPYPQVTVIVPALSIDDYLSECLLSLSNVDYRKLEILLIGDFEWRSDDIDYCSNLIKKSNFEIRFLTNYKAGLVNALNTGIKASKSEFIARLDSDDIIVPDRIKKQMEFLNEHPEYGLVGGQMEFIDQDGSVIQKISNHYPCSDSDIRSELKKRCCIAHPTVLFRKVIVESVGLYSEKFIAAEDYDLWLKLVQRTKLANLPDIVTRYRIHDGQSSSNSITTSLYSYAAQICFTNQQAIENMDNNSLISLEYFVHEQSKVLFDEERYFDQYTNLLINSIKKKNFIFMIISFKRILSVSKYKTIKFLLIKTSFHVYQILHKLTITKFKNLFRESHNS